MSRIRTFVAIETTPATRRAARQLIDVLRRDSDADVRWVTPETIHCTLKFLGDVPEIEIPSLCTTVAAAVAPFTPFHLEYHGLGAFPNLARPHTLWVGAREGVEPCRCLHEALDQALFELGFARERRRFRPHLTIGRVRQGADRLAERLREKADFLLGDERVEAVTVFASYLDDTGPTHEVLAQAALTGP